MTNSEIKKMVDRFLSWPLPKTVCSDSCVTDSNYPHQRVGTNLLTADEAMQMFEYVLTPPEKKQPPWTTFKNATCKGSVAFGNGCGHCEKCEWERSQA